MDDWQIPNNKDERPLRKTNYVIPPDSGTENSDSENSVLRDQLPRTIRRYRHERRDSDSKGSIPRMELAKHYKRQQKLHINNSDSELTSSLSDNSIDSDATIPINYQTNDNLDLQSDNEMSVNEAFIVPYQRISKSGGNKSLDTTCSLLMAIIGLFKASELHIN